MCFISPLLCSLKELSTFSVVVIEIQFYSSILVTFHLILTPVKQSWFEWMLGKQKKKKKNITEIWKNVGVRSKKFWWLGGQNDKKDERVKLKKQRKTQWLSETQSSILMTWPEWVSKRTECVWERESERGHPELTWQEEMNERMRAGEKERREGRWGVSALVLL